ncbi:glycosyltransferase family 4 protein [Corallibacter sp.]|uniref:glycosyltransferase family 4 protein n=1 Tax=Corallibacter sp. TaxID=2038084 RepID=UPI003A8E84B8
MRIGLVLSKPPAYSETFFNAKIKGLQEKGHEVVLFCQTLDHADEITSNEKSNTDKTTTKPYEIKQFTATKGSFFKRVLLAIQVFFKVLPYTARVLKWYALEKNKGIIAFLKDVYINAPLLTSNLDWIHYGFATLALERESLASVMQVKMAVSFRGYDINVYPQKHPECYKKLWLYVDKIHTISHHLLETAYTLGLPKSTQVRCIYPAVDVSRLPEPQAIQQSNKHTLVTVARLHWIKGIDYIIEIASKLKQENIDFVWYVIGDGTQKDVERYRYHAYEKGLSNDVVFVGKCTHDKTLRYMQKASVYIQTSLNEGFCNAVLEAQAMGKLSVAFNTGALSENIIHSQTGWLVKPFDIDAMIKTLTSVLYLPEEEKQVISKQARQRVNNTFLIEKQQEAFNAFYTT